MVEGISVKEKWPIIGEFILTDDFFKLSTCTLYVDFPNGRLVDFCNELVKIYKQNKNENLETIISKIKKVESEYTEILEDIGKAVQFKVRKIPFSSKKIGIIVKVDWVNVLPVLEDFAYSNKKLEEKYNYLSWCRCVLGRMKSLPNDEQIKNRVTALVSQDISYMNQSIEQIIGALSESRSRLRQQFSKNHDLSMTTIYLPELIASFKTIKNNMNEGIITACYREMRNVLENLAWSMLDDFLLFKRRENNLFESPPYRSTSKNWYEWARNKKIQLNNSEELKKQLQTIIDTIYLMGKINDYSWDKKAIRKELITNMSYPLLLLSSGKKIDNSNPDDDIPDAVPHFEVQEVIPLFQEHLKNRVTDLKQMPLSETEEKFLVEYVNSIIETNKGVIVPPYPSNRFVLEMVGYFTQQDLKTQYSEYSFFVHSYNDTWQHLPFSSVLEFKILKFQLGKFMKTISRVMNAYFSALPQTSRLKFPDEFS